MNLYEKSTYFVYDDLSYGKVMSSHGSINDEITNIYYILILMHMAKEVECTTNNVVCFSTFTSHMDYQNIIHFGI